MSARSLRSGIIKTGDSIQRATRQNTTLLKTENGFQQARQIDKRPSSTLTFMLPSCSPPKRKRKESPPKKKQETVVPKRNDNKSKPFGKSPIKKEESTKEVSKSSNFSRSNISPKELHVVENSMKRTPRMASLNAIVKVNAVLDSLCRAENKKKAGTGVAGGKQTTGKTIGKGKVESAKGKNTDKKINANIKEGRKFKSINTNCKNKGRDVKLKKSNTIDKVKVVENEKVKKEPDIQIVDDVDKKKRDKGDGKAIENKINKKVTSRSDDSHKPKEGTCDKDNGDACERNEKTKITAKDGAANTKETKITGRDASKKETKVLVKEGIANKKDAIMENDKDVESNKMIWKGENTMVSTSSRSTSKCTSTVTEAATSHSVTSKTTISSQSRKKTCAGSVKNKVNSTVEVVIETCSDDTSEISDSDMSLPESIKEFSEGVKMCDQAVQTDVNNKSIQTDMKHLPNLSNKQLCTCKLESESTPAISHYSPVNPDYLTKPFYVKSSIMAHTNTHTLVVPIKKRHVLKEKENEYSKPSITNNISSLIDACINNTLLQNNNTCSKLVYLSNYKEKSVVLNTPNVDAKKDNPKPCKTVHLQVPQVNFGTVSEPKSTTIDKSNSKSMPVSSAKQKIKSPPGRRRKCNGWQFEGDPMEEPYTLGNQIITRRHYESVCRNKEVLRLHDAVLLKSGMAKGDSDYVARISMFWEDLTGPHSSDMMMSIYWYYKPEQTNFKFPETSKMEVYASRHRDDNSVACIVEKCYVISFTQFCRFQAQKMLLKEKRKKKLKVVPENKNLQSRFLPSPDVDESIVFFCRYGYEYRCGKLIKGL